MNKQQILDKLKSLNLDKNKITIISGASLVVHGVIDQTGDIDMACEKEYYKQIPWQEKIGFLKKNIKCYDLFEVGTSFYNPQNTDIIDGFRFMNLQDCLKLKKITNRQKDQEVIKKLEKILNS
ncbi:MAG: hypothetical protein E7378_01395 [Clostridiales bacterium]|nr:hypothetical protein [Clostridiales bacterium]